MSDLTPIDEIDRMILKRLQQNAREKMSSVAESVNLSLPSVIRRIQRMEDSGIIKGYVTEIDGEKVGRHVHGILVGGVYKRSLGQFYEYIKTVDSVVRCDTIICGGKEIFLEFYVDNEQQLMEFYESGIRKYLDSMTVYLLSNTNNYKKTLKI